VGETRVRAGRGSLYFEVFYSAIKIGEILTILALSKILFFFVHQLEIILCSLKIMAGPA
jgi:hypothetical protein